MGLTSEFEDEGSPQVRWASMVRAELIWKHFRKRRVDARHQSLLELRFNETGISRSMGFIRFTTGAMYIKEKGVLEIFGNATCHRLSVYGVNGGSDV